MGSRRAGGAFVPRPFIRSGLEERYPETTPRAPQLPAIVRLKPLLPVENFGRQAFSPVGGFQGKVGESARTFRDERDGLFKYSLRIRKICHL